MGNYTMVVDGSDVPPTVEEGVHLAPSDLIQ